MKTNQSSRFLISGLLCGLGSAGGLTAANLALYEFNGGSTVATSSAASVITTNFLAVGADPGQGISSFSEAAFINRFDDHGLGTFRGCNGNRILLS